MPAAATSRGPRARPGRARRTAALAVSASIDALIPSVAYQAIPLPRSAAWLYCENAVTPIRWRAGELFDRLVQGGADRDGVGDNRSEQQSANPIHLTPSDNRNTTYSHATTPAGSLPISRGAIHRKGVVLLRMRAEELKGHLDGLLLAALEQGPLHGYGVIERLRIGSVGRIDLPTGTVYPALHRLERAGLVRSHWSDASGRRRRSYELTTNGIAALDSSRAGWAEFSAAVSALLQGRSWPAVT